MGAAYSRALGYGETFPDYKNPPTFDPLLGFENGRKERVPQATREEMEAANVPLEKRDYCAHLYIKLKECRTANYPFTKTNCHHEKHSYHQCEFDDHVLRLKEYEREKRLKERARRIRLKNPEEAIL